MKYKNPLTPDQLQEVAQKTGLTPKILLYMHNRGIDVMDLCAQEVPGGKRRLYEAVRKY